MQIDEPDVSIHVMKCVRLQSFNLIYALEVS